MKLVTTIKNFVTQEKAPLVLLVLAQAYVLFLWMIGSSIYELPELTIGFAIITAVSLDSVVVSTTFSKHRSRWSWTTSLVAMISGVLIVIDLFYRMEWHWIHATFPVLVFFFSQHLAEEKALQSGNNEGIIGNKEEMITRLLDVLGDETPDYKIAKIVGGKTQKTIGIVKEIKESRKEIVETSEE